MVRAGGSRRSISGRAGVDRGRDRAADPPENGSRYWRRRLGAACRRESAAGPAGCRRPARTSILDAGPASPDHPACAGGIAYGQTTRPAVPDYSACGENALPYLGAAGSRSRPLQARCLGSRGLEGSVSRETARISSGWRRAPAVPCRACRGPGLPPRRPSAAGRSPSCRGPRSLRGSTACRRHRR